MSARPWPSKSKRPIRAQNACGVLWTTKCGTAFYESSHFFEVLEQRSVLPKVVARYGHINQIIIAVSAISGKQLDEIVELCRHYSPNVQVAPGLDELFMGKVSISDLRDVQIGDLLGRESAKVDFNEERLKTFLGGKTILVTGAGGSIGSELCFQILKFRREKSSSSGAARTASTRPSTACSCARAASTRGNDQRRAVIYSKLNRIFSRPELVFHAAADKHVPLMESNPDEAVLDEHHRHPERPDRRAQMQSRVHFFRTRPSTRRA